MTTRYKRRIILTLMLALLGSASLVVAPPASAAGPRYFSGVRETATPGYWGFRHRIQHRDLGPPGGIAQTFEITCGTNSAGEVRFANNNVLARLDIPLLGEGWWIEMLAFYECGPDGVFRRTILAKATFDWQLVSIKPQSFADTGVNHDYQIVHTHGSAFGGCGSLPAARAWFMVLDGSKFSCAGFHDALFSSSAPHASEGQHFLEIDDATGIKARHHVLDVMQTNFGTSWNIANWDQSFIETPTGGHGDTAFPREWWHACAQQTATCH